MARALLFYLVLRNRFARNTAAVGGAKVLHRPTRHGTQRSGSMQRPIRITKEFPSEQHQIGAPASHDFSGLRSLGDHSNAAGGHACLLSDFFRERSLERWADWNLRVRNEPTGRNIHQVDTVVLELAGEPYGLRKVPTTIVYP